jgi:hypothetical protein
MAARSWVASGPPLPPAASLLLPAARPAPAVWLGAPLRWPPLPLLLLRRRRLLLRRPCSVLRGRAALTLPRGVVPTGSPSLAVASRAAAAAAWRARRSSCALADARRSCFRT